MANMIAHIIKLAMKPFVFSVNKNAIISITNGANNIP